MTDGIDSTDATNSFNLAAVNDVPELSGVKAALVAGTEDTVYTIETSDLLTGYSDADTGETATLSILGLSATDGFITQDATTGDYTYTPNPDFNGEVTLNYVVSDGNGGNLLATNSFNIEAVNDKPVRTAGNVTTLYFIEDGDIASIGLESLNYSVGGGSDEADSQDLTYTVTELPPADKGTIFLDDGTTAVAPNQALELDELRGLMFRPAPDADGSVAFSFSVTDSGDGDNTITETVNIEIIGFNDAPILPVDAISIDDASEDTAYTFSPADLLAGVTDPDVVYDADGNITSRDVDQLQVLNLSVSNGDLSYDAEGDEYTFTPDSNFQGMSLISYTILDGKGGSVFNTVQLNVIDDGTDKPVLDGEVATLFTGIDEDSIDGFRVSEEEILRRYTDYDKNQALSISSFELANQEAGTVLKENGEYIFTPAQDFSGIVSFNFTVSDSTANGGLEQTYSINVAEINDAPTINLPNSRTDLSIVGGTQQFVSFNDFGYQDIEGDLLDKVEIMAPSSEIATIYRSNVAFSTEGKTALDVSDDGKVILERDLLTGNRIFIETTFTSIGRSDGKIRVSATIEFRVFDG